MIIAEKFQAMVQLGIANSRTKDFFDIWFCLRSNRFRCPAARIHPTLSVEIVMLELQKVKGDPKLGGIVEDALEDCGHTDEWSISLELLRASADFEFRRLVGTICQERCAA